jgi:hypothetical protein
MARKKLRTIWDNQWFDAAALTPSSEVATLPARNLQDPLRQRAWRTAGLSGEFLIADLGLPTLDVRPPVTALVLINHNLTQSAQVTIEASLSNDFGSPLISETQAAWGDIIGAGEGGAGVIGAGGRIPDCQRALYAPNPLRIIYLDSVPQEAKGFWKIAFSDPGNPDGYIQVGRMFLTYYDEYKYDWAYPWDLGGYDDSTVIYSTGGQPWTDRRPMRRAIHLVWNNRFADEDKYWRFYYMLMQVGISRDWVLDVIPDGVSSRFFTSLYGRFDPNLSSGNYQLPTLTQQFKGFSNLEMNFVESL